MSLKHMKGCVRVGMIVDLCLGGGGGQLQGVGGGIIVHSGWGANYEIRCYPYPPSRVVRLLLLCAVLPVCVQAVFPSGACFFWSGCSFRCLSNPNPPPPTLTRGAGG